MTSKEIDPQQLKLIEQRFTRLSLARLDKMLSGFNLTQADSIRLLPLLFHLNYPILPGYVNSTTPCGLPNYHPTDLDKKIAKTVARSFKFKSRAYLKFEIAGLYLMGSTGTLGQSVHSDLDLWVCLSENLEAAKIIELQKKMQLISQWMATRGIELNCYLVHKDDFSHNITRQLTKDSCGGTQNFLLLDEFYRTAIWLCGRKPLWWLVKPGEFYDEISSRLLQNKHVDSFDWIDFGEVGEIPASEYFSAALWQMYKAIESPYKSSLKLLLLEIYARYFPQTGLLSSQYKSLVYQEQDDSEKLDPYLMILHCAEDFLKAQPQRLEFLRRAFYLKAGAKIQQNKKYLKNWRYQQIQRLVKRWGWNSSRLKYLNDRPNWRINSVINEREDLVRELTHSYHFLANFARVNGVQDKTSQNELLSLGRKLHVEFDRRAGKIDRVNNGIARDVMEPSITLYQKTSVKGIKEWGLILGAVTKNELAIHQFVYSAKSFFKVLVWGVCNQVVNRKTQSQVYSDDEFFNREKASEFIKNILLLRNKNKIKAGHADFLTQSKIKKMGVYLNTLCAPLEPIEYTELYRSAHQQELFCCGTDLINLLPQFHVFSINSWGESVCQNYQGEFAWIKLFCDYTEAVTEANEILYFYADKLTSIGKIRLCISGLFERWSKLLISSQRKSKQYRYLMSSGCGFLMIDFINGEISYQFFSELEGFLFSLGCLTTSIIEYHLDDNLKLSDNLKKTITKAARSELNIYILQNTAVSFEVVVIEPGGQVFYQAHQNVKLSHLISHYQQFFDSVNQCFGFLMPDSSISHYWCLDNLSDSHSQRFKRVKYSDGKIAEHYSKVQAIAHVGCDNKVSFDLYVGEQAYCYCDYSELIYRKLAQYVVKSRAYQQNYPIFITNLDLSAFNHKPGLIEYLSYKREIEQKLTHALQQMVAKSG